MSGQLRTTPGRRRSKRGPRHIVPLDLARKWQTQRWKFAHGAACGVTGPTPPEPVSTARPGAREFLEMQTRRPFSLATCWQLAWLCVGEVPGSPPLARRQGLWFPALLEAQLSPGSARPPTHGHPPLQIAAGCPGKPLPSSDAALGRVAAARAGGLPDATSRVCRVRTSGQRR